MDFSLFVESTFEQLYQSAVNAFPNTTRRQHATGTIVISEIRYLPYLGTKTLLIRAHADNSADNGGQYDPILVMKNVRYHKENAVGLVEVVASDNGQSYFLSPLSRAQNHVLIRCACGDAHWRFQNEDFEDRSWFGANRKPYIATTARGPVNPTHAIGACKHVMKLFQVLQDNGLIVH